MYVLKYTKRFVCFAVPFTLVCLILLLLRLPLSSLFAALCPIRSVAFFVHSKRRQLQHWYTAIALLPPKIDLLLLFVFVAARFYLYTQFFLYRSRLHAQLIHARSSQLMYIINLLNVVTWRSLRNYYCIDKNRCDIFVQSQLPFSIKWIIVFDCISNSIPIAIFVWSCVKISFCLHDSDITASRRI